MEVNLLNLITFHKECKNNNQVLSDMMKPKIYDLALVDLFYVLFKYVLFERDGTVKDDKDTKKKALAVALIFFSPQSFCGEYMTLGLRDRISAVFRCDASGISHNIKDVIFLYTTYKEFKAEVDYLYTAIYEKFKAKEIIE